MKILEFRAENLKRLTVVEITPEGNIVQISGKNGSGKSSVLDAIWFALAGADAIQAEPIRAGTNKARIRLDLGEIVVERTFTEKGTYLKVTNADGATFQAPQKMLDGLVGALSFDPLAFASMKPTEQIAQVQALTGLDGDAVKMANRSDYDARAEFNRDAKMARGKADGIEVRDDLPTDSVNVSELVEKLTAVDRGNAEIKAAAEARDSLLERINKGKALIASLEAEAEALYDTAAREPVPTDDLNRKLEQSTEINRNIDARKAWQELTESAEKDEAAADELTKRMAKRTADFKADVAKATLPIDGLSLDLERGILFNDVPFEQAANADQIRVSTALAMAMNPKVRVLRIMQGSLLDEDSLALIAAMADKEDYQIWIETVDSTGDIGIMMEDGHVAGVEPEASEYIDVDAEKAAFNPIDDEGNPAQDDDPEPDVAPQGDLI